MAPYQDFMLPNGLAMVMVKRSPGLQGKAHKVKARAKCILYHADMHIYMSVYMHFTDMWSGTDTIYPTSTNELESRFRVFPPHSPFLLLYAVNTCT